MTSKKMKSWSLHPVMTGKSKVINDWSEQCAVGTDIYLAKGKDSWLSAHR